MPISRATRQLLDACQTGDLVAVKAAVAAGANVCVYNGHRTELSPVLIAVKHDHLGILKYLVGEAGASAALDNNWALRYTASNGRFEILRWLVEESGQDIELTIANNRVVSDAIRSGNTELFLWLVNDSPEAEAFHQLEVSQRHLELLAPGHAALQEIFDAEKAKLLAELARLQQCCFRSAVCRQAAAAGLVHSVEQLQELLLTTPQKHKSARQL